MCQMCQHSHAPYRVLTYGWNNELIIPTQIPLCQRCKDNWTPQTHLHYVDMNKISEKDTVTFRNKILNKYFGRKRVVNR